MLCYNLNVVVYYTSQNYKNNVTFYSDSKSVSMSISTGFLYFTKTCISPDHNISSYINYINQCFEI